MRKLKTRHILAGVLLVFTTTIISPSCAISNESRSTSQRQALMMQDKSEYSRNRSNYRGSKSYKKQLKRNRRYKKNRMRR